MASQEEWRQIRHQQWLGEQGKTTGTLVNDRAYQQFRHNEASKAARSYDPPKVVLPTAVPLPKNTVGDSALPRVGPIQEGARTSRGVGRQDGHTFIDWFMVHVWPLRAAATSGDWLISSTWKLRLPAALLGAFVAAVSSGSTEPAPVLLGIGALAGWFAPSILGGVMILTARLVAVLLAVVTVVLTLALAYVVIVSLANRLGTSDNAPETQRIAPATVSAPATSATPPATDPPSLLPIAEPGARASEPVVAAVAMPDIAGTWFLSRPDQADGTPRESLTLSIDGTVLIAEGDGWRGTGEFDGRQGYYVWSFADGRTGRTELRVGEHGALHGSVQSGDIAWSFRGERQ